ncbi:MAG TPA: DUF1566 domain-containing protein [bacterium]|nr:DUF1566 domain-containing protein [bacterium]HOG43544.1 DUF1566 domain-containing protein [bacterium]HQB08368.1 DUF1566 domain-containing protein [bacterium]
MIKRILLMITVVFVLTMVFDLSGEEKSKLAVMEFEDRSATLDQTMLSNAAEYLRSGFVGSDRFIIIAKERQEKALIQEMKKESYQMCRERNCQIPLGQALSADSILRTTINYFGGIYNITTELIDLAKEATVKGAKFEFDGSESELKKNIDKIVVQIVEISEKKVVKEIDKDDSEKKKNEIKKEEINKQENEKTIQSRTIKWSEKSDKTMSWSESKKYCENLKEDGYSDWRLPAINELRTLIKNCTYTVTKGKCNVTNDCTDRDKCHSSYCDGCPYRIDGEYSIFGDSGVFWSITELSDGSVKSWTIDFGYAEIGYNYRIKKYFVRCVRNGE